MATVAVAMGIMIGRRAHPATAEGILSGSLGEAPKSPDPILLDIDKAILHGPTLAVYGSGSERHVAGWNSTTCSLEWFVSAPRAGWYKVDLTYATGVNNGGKYLLKTEKDEWTGREARRSALMKDEETLDTPEQRMLHGLLTDLFDPSREARIRMAMKSMQSSRPSILARVAAALLFMAAGAGAALLVMDRLPEARAVIDRATREAREATDRQYRVTVEALKPSMAEPVASGVLHVRGSEAFAIQFEAPFAKGWYGSDGRETWFRPAEGAVIRWPADQKASWKEREKLDFVQFESFLREHRDRFDVATIERRDGVLRVRATRKLTAVGEPIPQFEVWVSEKTGVMTRLQCRLDPELWHWDPWLVTIEHEKDLLHPSGYYAAESDSR